MKSKTLFFFKLIILTGFVTAHLVPTIFCKCSKGIDFTSITVDIREIRLQTMTADVRVYIDIMGFLNQSDLSVIIRNQWYDRDTHDFYVREDQIFTLEKTSEWTVNDVTVAIYENITEHQFSIFGSKYVYPYDSYLLNFTIQLYTDAPILNETTTLIVHTWPDEWQAPQIPASLVKNKQFWKEITTQIIINRAKGPIGFESLYISLTLILGFSYLIYHHIEKIALYVAVMLQISQLINIYTIDAPPKAGLTYMHQLIYSLLFFIIIFAISDTLGLYIKQYEKNNEAIPEYVEGLYEVIYHTAPVINCALFMILFIPFKIVYEKYWWIKLPNYFVIYVVISFMVPYLIKNTTIIKLTIVSTIDIIQHTIEKLKPKRKNNDV